MKVLACVVSCLLAGVSGAAAAGVGPEKATEMLAHAWMVDNRCNVLDKAERDQLTDLVARAEISLAEMKSVKAATGAISKGRASGLAASCDAKSASDVRNTLAAATSAVTSSGAAAQPDTVPEAIPQAAPEAVTVEAAAPEPEPIVEQQAQQLEPEPIVEQALQTEPAAKPKRFIKPVEAAQAPAAKQRKPKPAAIAKFKTKPQRPSIKREQPITLAVATKRQPVTSGYGQTAENYYRELRCRKLSARAINAMYARVLREHRRAVAASGKSAVRQVLRSAASRASGGSC